MLRQAARPVILMGRVSRDETAWQQRLALAEALGAHVATAGKTGAAFPTGHKLHIGAPATFPTEALKDALRSSDLVLSLDWVDLGGTMTAACGPAPAAKVIQVSLDHHLHNGWSMDHQGLPAVDLNVLAEPDAATEALLAELRKTRRTRPAARAVAQVRDAARLAPKPARRGMLAIGGHARGEFFRYIPEHVLTPRFAPNGEAGDEGRQAGRFHFLRSSTDSRPAERLTTAARSSRSAATPGLVTVK